MKTNNYTYIFLNKKDKHITATFRNGKQVNFTTNVLNLLLTDPEVETIAETKTGNIIYYR